MKPAIDFGTCFSLPMLRVGGMIFDFERAEGIPTLYMYNPDEGKDIFGYECKNGRYALYHPGDVIRNVKTLLRTNPSLIDNPNAVVSGGKSFSYREIVKKYLAYLIDKATADKLANIVLVDKKNPKTGVVTKIVNRDCVGRDARVILEKVGIKVGADVRCIICETEFEHPFVQHELMMPILPIVSVPGIDKAIDLACKAEHGNRHTAHMHSKNIDNLTRFARAVETTIFVKNAPSYAGIGFGGEGHTTFTIAGPTGEGLTSARSFTRYRRCVLAESFRII